MFNPNRPVYQIGIEDGGGSIHCNRYEVPKPEKLIQLKLHYETNQWVHGADAPLFLFFDQDIPEPTVAVGETATIKIRDYVIQCKKCSPQWYTILSIKHSDGAVFNTLQLVHKDPLVKMLRAPVYVPIKDLYK